MENPEDVYAKCKRMVTMEESTRKQAVEEALTTMQSRLAVEERARTQVGPALYNHSGVLVVAYFQSESMLNQYGQYTQVPKWLTRGGMFPPCWCGVKP